MSQKVIGIVVGCGCLLVVGIVIALVAVGFLASGPGMEEMLEDMAVEAIATQETENADGTYTYSDAAIDEFLDSCIPSAVQGLKNSFPSAPKSAIEGYANGSCNCTIDRLQEEMSIVTLSLYGGDFDNGEEKTDEATEAEEIFNEIIEECGEENMHHLQGYY